MVPPHVTQMSLRIHVRESAWYKVSIYWQSTILKWRFTAKNCQKFVRIWQLLLGHVDFVSMCTCFAIVHMVYILLFILTIHHLPRSVSSQVCLHNFQPSYSSYTYTKQWGMVKLGEYQVLLQCSFTGLPQQLFVLKKVYYKNYLCSQLTCTWY